MRKVTIKVDLPDRETALQWERFLNSPAGQKNLSIYAKLRSLENCTLEAIEKLLADEMDELIALHMEDALQWGWGEEEARAYAKKQAAVLISGFVDRIEPEQRNEGPL